jgi:hypothetical protein
MKPPKCCKCAGTVWDYKPWYMGDGHLFCESLACRNCGHRISAMTGKAEPVLMQAVQAESLPKLGGATDG